MSRSDSKQLIDILLRPIPDQAVAFARKKNYRDYPLFCHDAHAKDPLVDIAEYGVAGQSYYSRSNPATGTPVPGVNPVVRVRRSLAEVLSSINYALQSTDMVEEIFGQPVELYVEEGLRTDEMQRELYEKVFPRLIH